MRKVKVAAIQMSMTSDVTENIQKADAMVREAASKGANVVLLPELFERTYFCQERCYEYYAYATPVEENPAVKHFREVCRELDIVMPISFFTSLFIRKLRKPNKISHCVILPYVLTYVDSRQRYH